MKIINSYSPLLASRSLRHAHPIFKAWDYTDKEVSEWFQEHQTEAMAETAENYLLQVKEVVEKVENHFSCSLPGELVLIPSMGEVDGFARYDSGHHTVLLGIDFPEGSLEYLKALTAHELSHVYRDHCPKVWGFLGKPLAQISRNEYLEATSGREHLVSEGLATLNSQAVYPEIPKHLHHYYDERELSWCEQNQFQIDQALKACLKQNDPDPWQFYSPGSVARGSPSRTHYYWAAKKIAEWLVNHLELTLVQAHALHASEIGGF